MLLGPAAGEGFELARSVGLAFEDEALDDRLRLEDRGEHEAQRRFVGTGLVVLGLPRHAEREAEVDPLLEEQLAAGDREVFDAGDRPSHDAEAGAASLHRADRGVRHPDARERGVGDPDLLQGFTSREGGPRSRIRSTIRLLARSSCGNGPIRATLTGTPRRAHSRSTSASFQIWS